jgi:L-methionine (R)-S-oxide reductase
MLGPYNGRPACLSISISPSRGVCGNSFTTNTTLVVPDVEAYPGHIGMSNSFLPFLSCLPFPLPPLYSEFWKEGDRGKELMKACDGLTKSEIVIPLYMSDKSTPVGVLDLDSTVLGTFDEDDKDGLERIVEILRRSCDWA